MPESGKHRKPGRAQRARIRVADSKVSTVIPEAAAAKGTAAKATSTAAKKSAAKTSAPTKTAGPKKSAATPRKKDPAARAATYTKERTVRRVQQARESHRKTAAAVEVKQRKDKVLGLAEMHPKVRMLSAEYMAAVLMAIIMLFLRDKTYHEKMSRFFIQMVGISGIFFVLALGASSEKTSRYVIPFGLLIDISMLAFLFKQGGGKVISAVSGGGYKDPNAKSYDDPHTPPGQNEIAPGLVIIPNDQTLLKDVGNAIGSI